MEGFWLVSGIAAVYSLDRYANSTPLLWRMLYALKHRGGGRMSICAFEDEDRFVTFTKPVEASSSSPPDELMSQLRSPYAIGYVGQEIQPFIRREKPVFATSLDGKLSDPARLRATYAMMGCRFETWEDVEVFSIALASEYGICSDWVDAFSGVMEEVGVSGRWRHHCCERSAWAKASVSGSCGRKLHASSFGELCDRVGWWKAPR